MTKLIGLTGEDAKALLREAVRVTHALGQLEEDLRLEWEKLIHSQQEAELVHEPDDFLWRPSIGWAVAEEKSTGDTLNVYLRLRASVVKVKVARFYVNVTRAEAYRSRLKTLVAHDYGPVGE